MVRYCYGALACGLPGLLCCAILMLEREPPMPLPAGAPAPKQKPARGLSGATAADLCRIALFTVLLAVCSWIALPTAIPFTLQTLAVCTAACLLKPAHSHAVMWAYLLLGAVGVPVFHNFTAGVGIIVGPTGGFLLGFLPAMPLVSWLHARLGAGFWRTLLAMLPGMLVYDIFGTVWYALLYAGGTGAAGWAAAFSVCVAPFIIPDLLKLAAAAWLVQKLQPHLMGKPQ